jgi:hypothetical protein
LLLDETESKKPLSLSFNHKLFVGSHVPDIVISKPQRQTSGEIAATLPKATKDELLTEHLEVSKALGETIRVSTTRKIHVDNLIKSMMKESGVEQGAEEEQRKLKATQLDQAPLKNSDQNLVILLLHFGL